MKKIALVVSLVSICGFSQAEYMFKVPLETPGGGNLPKGSIVIGDATTPPTTPPVTPPAAVDECENPVTGVFVWRANKTTGAGNVIWNGTAIGTIAAGATSVNGVNGIVYTKNDKVAPLNSGAFNVYGVCRNIPAGFNGGTWNSIAATVSAWTNTGSVHSCSWTPDAGSFLPSQSVNQTGFNCQQKQQRTTQLREQNDSTLVIRNVGAATISYQDISVDDNPERTIAGTDTTSAPETCVNDPYGSTSTSWVVDLTDNNNVSFINWKGNTLSENQQLGQITSFTHNGVVYKKSNFIGDLSAGNPAVVYAKAYGICRVNN